MQQITAGFGRVLLSALMFSLFSGAAFAADTFIFATKKGAIRGADPVAYFSLKAGDDAVMGTDEFTYEWSGAIWKFSSAENRDLFMADPEQYTPQYGGYCAFAVSHNFTKTTKPDMWEIVDGKLYLNYNRTAYKKWVKDKAESIVRADANWPSVLKRCEKYKNCRSPRK